ncbi:gelsolin family protein [Aspergillus lucknowensis]|uniref:Gelsolin-like domain-containing protein n=1 Tax=Aspergillus lucknowensis TaxID=176173 RepID=A0ABR4L5T8_9EURO
MAPHEGLVHPQKYDIKDSNVELINSDLDHRVKHASASTEPAWNNGVIGIEPGLFIWRIENFLVVPWPKERTGEFFAGDSYIVLHSVKVKKKGGGGEGEGENVDDEKKNLHHDIFFWLGAHTTQDEAGTAAYKTVELDEFLHGSATQHREVQEYPSEEFTSLFRRVTIRSGGVASGFTHVEEETPKEITTLLRVFKYPGASGRIDSTIVYEVEPSWESLDDDDVFVLDKGEKIWVWQGKNCSPMEKAKAAQVVNDMTLAKHVDVEVLSRHEARSKVVVDLLGGGHVDTSSTTFKAPRPIAGSKSREKGGVGSKRLKKLFRLSDASGQLEFDLVKEGGSVRRSDFNGDDVFLYDVGCQLWVWQGLGASAREKALWLKVSQAYVRHMQSQEDDLYMIPIAKVVQGYESPSFLKVVEF